jgi:hypothetical protein
MKDVELLYIFDLFRNKYNIIYSSYNVLDLLLYSINKYLQADDCHLGQVEQNNPEPIYPYELITNMTIFINEYQSTLNTPVLDTDTLDIFNTYKVDKYKKLYKLLNQYIPFYDMTYFDLMVINVATNDNMTETQQKNIKTIIINSFQYESNNLKTLIKRLELLIYDSYQNLMNIYSHSLIDLQVLFNHQHINIIFGYFLILGHDNLKRDEYWSLLDISFNYLYQLIMFLNSQISFNEVLIKNFESDGLYSLVTKQKTYLVNFIKKILHKSGTFLINNPRTIEEYRIFYNLYNFFYIELKQSQFIKFKQLHPQNHYSEGLAQEFLISLNFNISRTPYKKYLINHKIILENSNILLNETYYYNLDNNLNIFISINQLFERIIKLKPKIESEENIFIESWKNKYYNYVIYLLDKLTLSCSRLMSFINKYNETKELTYYDYQLFTLDVFFISKMIKELPITTRNILNNNINFEFSQLYIEKYILVVLKLFTNTNFINLFSKLFKRPLRFNIYLRCKSSKVIFNDYHKIIKSKNDIWVSIISYLEIEDNRKIEMINKLVQSGFDYNKLEAIFIDDLDETWIRLFTKFNNNNYQEQLDSYLEEFGDPFTNEMIKIPMVLPLTGQIVDKDVIIKILHNKACNPFNNIPLGIEELEEYNQKPEIKEQNQIFIEKLNKIKTELDLLFEKS